MTTADTVISRLEAPGPPIAQIRDGKGFQGTIREVSIDIEWPMSAIP